MFNPAGAIIPFYGIYCAAQNVHVSVHRISWEKKEKMKTEPLLPSSPTVIKGEKKVVPKKWEKGLVHTRHAI